MEKEISSGTMLGVVIIALAATIGLAFGVFSIAKGVAEEGLSETPTENIEITIPTITGLSFILAGCSFAEYTFLRKANKKLQIWDNDRDEHENIINKCDIDIYEDAAQVRVPKKISMLKAARCKVSDVAELKTIGFGNTKIVNIQGKVETHGNFYTIGNSKLARGLILLEEDSEVNITIKTKVNVETALGIYRIYDVI